MMNLEVLEAYKNMALELDKKERLVEELTKQLSELVIENDKKVYIEDICYLGFDETNVFVRTDKEKDIINYLNDLKVKDK